MATVVRNSVGLTSPSSTTQYFGGGDGSLPPANGTIMSVSRAEFTTGEYSDASADDTSYANFGSGSYSGCEFGFKLPGGTISEFSFSVIAKGYDGYSIYGWRLYIKNINTPAWELLGEATGSVYETLSDSKTVSLSNYIDENSRVWLLAICRAPADGNGTGSEIFIDYAEMEIVYSGFLGLEDHRKKLRDYPMYILRQSTERIIRVGPAMDPTDAVTPVTTLTLSGADQAELLKAAGVATVSLAAATWGAIADSDGWYNLTLTTSHTDTLGDVEVVVQDANVCLPVYAKGVVIPAPVFDALFAGTDYLQTDLIQLGSDTQSGTDLKDFVDAGYDPSVNKVEGVKLVDTTTVNTDMITVAQIWQTLIALHSGVVGSVAEALSAVGTPATASAIAAAVLVASGATAEATAGDDTMAAAMALLLNKKAMSGDYLIVYKRDGVTEFFRILLTTDSDAEPVVGTGTST